MAVIEHASNSISDTIHYLDTQAGLRPFTSAEATDVMTAMSLDLIGGTEQPKHPGSLKMIDTHLSPVPQETLKQFAGEEVFVLTIGGTNVAASWITILPDGSPAVIHDRQTDEVLKSGGKLRTRVFKSPDEFFTEVLSHVGVLARLRPINNLAIVYTFPALVIDTPQGVDVLSPDKLPKGFFIEGISKRPVGEQFVEFMRKSGDYAIDNLKALAILNDTPAVLRDKLGGIVGSGYNLAVSVAGTIYNIECGGETSVPTYPLVEIVDAGSENPGEQLSEKQISGLYIGQQLEVAIRDLNEQGILNLKVIPEYSGEGKREPLPSEVLSYILDGNTTKLEHYFQGAIVSALPALTAIAERIRARSAQFVALQLASVVNTFPNEFLDNEVVVPIVGSIFWLLPGHQRLVKLFAETYTGKTFIFPPTPDEEAKGAAVAAIGVRAKLK